MSALAVATAGGTLALPRALSSALLPRVLGLYIAACAGTIQLLDILVERLQLDDRVFTFAIILTVIGIPFAAAGALLADTARGEKRRPTAGVRTERPTPGVPAASRQVARDRTDAVADRLHRQLDVALSWHRIRVLASESGNDGDAAAHGQRTEAEIAALITDLRTLLAPPRPSQPRNGVPSADDRIV